MSNQEWVERYSDCLPYSESNVDSDCYVFDTVQTLRSWEQIDEYTDVKATDGHVYTEMQSADSMQRTSIMHRGASSNYPYPNCSSKNVSGERFPYLTQNTYQNIVYERQDWRPIIYQEENVGNPDEWPGMDSGFYNDMTEEEIFANRACREQQNSYGILYPVRGTGQCTGGCIIQKWKKYTQSTIGQFYNVFPLQYTPWPGQILHFQFETIMSLNGFGPGNTAYPELEPYKIRFGIDSDYTQTIPVPSIGQDGIRQYHDLFIPLNPPNGGLGYINFNLEAGYSFATADARDGNDEYPYDNLEYASLGYYWKARIVCPDEP